jgi:hypothetical protein
MLTCKQCKGSGNVPNPDYGDTIRKLDRRLDQGYLAVPDYERAITELYGSPDRAPMESIICPSCNGSGKLSGYAGARKRPERGRGIRISANR